MVSLFVNSFIIAWTWLTIRLKTKKHNTIRICVASVFVIFNFIVLVGVSKENIIIENDPLAHVVMITFYLILIALWAIRLVSDLLFVSKKTFEETEDDLSKILQEKLNIRKK